MNTLLLNIVWPAIEVASSLYVFWYLVYATIIIELFIIKYFLKYTWGKAFLAATVGNLVSGFVGTFLMMWGMIAWHIIGDLASGETFSTFNWVMTYILMCVGSVWLEAVSIKLMFRERIRRVFFPVLIGNLLSYLFIVFYMIDKKKGDVVRTETIRYQPNRSHLKLKDGSRADILTATILLEYDKKGKLLNERYPQYTLCVNFDQKDKGKFLFDFQLLESIHGSYGIEQEHKLLYTARLIDTYHVVAFGPSPDPDIGWQEKVILDTILFTRIK